MKILKYDKSDNKLFSENYKGENLEYLFDLERPEIGVIYNYDNKHYSISSIHTADNFAIARELILQDETETSYESSLMCPLCSHIHSDPYEYDEDLSVECGRCGAEFSFKREVIVEYHTKLITPPETINIEKP